MTQIEWIVLAVGIGMIVFFGLFHLGGLIVLRKLKPKHGQRPYAGTLIAFWGLLTLHAMEIGLGAYIYAWLTANPGFGTLGGDFGGTTADYLYFSGITFTTLGYAQAEAEGPIRLFVMLQALGGFMLITWSATFLYTIWGESFRED